MTTPPQADPESPRGLTGVPTVTLPLRCFDLAATLSSGQVFHWRAVDGGYLGLIDTTPVFLRQPTPDRLEVAGHDTTALAASYLALDHDSEAIVSTFPPNDTTLAAAVAFAPGLRLIRQPAWECLATFITSSLKQVPHIARLSHTLRERFGKPVDFGGGTLHTYPSPAALAAAGEAALRQCGLGYRAAYLAATARLVDSGAMDLGFLTDPDVPDDEAMRRLTQSPGVGPKVASCVLLFAGQRLGFFPIDVWIERALRERYFPRRRKFPTGFLPRFAHRHFGPYRGYAQQFLFHHARTANQKTKARTSAEAASSGSLGW
ncbi:MAG: DNA-3-methyladenine glycosylase family protein [Verrucomicrobiales bacterium]